MTLYKLDFKPFIEQSGCQNLEKVALITKDILALHNFLMRKRGENYLSNCGQ